jgi:hypothetical protein
LIDRSACRQQRVDWSTKQWGGKPNADGDCLQTGHAAVFYGGIDPIAPGEMIYWGSCGMVDFQSIKIIISHERTRMITIYWNRKKQEHLSCGHRSDISAFSFQL